MIQLSKWWKTPSARRAFGRVTKERNQRLRKARESAAKKRAQQKRVAAYGK